MIFHGGWPFPDPQRCKRRQRPGEWIPRGRGSGTCGGTRLPAAEHVLLGAEGQDVSSENLGVGSKSNCVLLHCRYFHTHQNDIEYIQYIELLHEIVILNEILMQPLGLSLEI